MLKIKVYSEVFTSKVDFKEIMKDFIIRCITYDIVYNDEQIKCLNLKNLFRLYSFS